MVNNSKMLKDEFRINRYHNKNEGKTVWKYMTQFFLASTFFYRKGGKMLSESVELSLMATWFWWNWVTLSYW